MELHYLTLKRQSEFLRDILTDAEIHSSYTQKKNEQIIQLKTTRPESTELLLSADAKYPFIIMKSVSRRVRNSTDVMPEIVGQIFSTVEILSSERIIICHFHNNRFKLYLQFFRNQSNFFIVDENNVILNAFKNKKKHIGKKFTIKPTISVNPLNNDFDSFRERFYKSEVPVKLFMKKQVLFLTQEIITEIELILNLDLTQLAIKFNIQQCREIYEAIQSFFKRCETDKPRIYQLSDNRSVFTITEFKQFKDHRYLEFESVNSALQNFFFQQLRMERLFTKRQRIEKIINNKLTHIQGLINHLKNLPDKSIEHAKYLKMGKLLLFHTHHLPPRKSEIEVLDFFDPKQRSITIKLDSKLTIKENAKKFLQRAKTVSKRQKEVRDKLQQLFKQQERVAQLKRSLHNVLNFKELSKIEKKLQEMFILQPDENRLWEIYLPYKTYQYQGWEIWVGKNAKSNDQMTFHLAHKEDLWLHAQGVSGSHVVIKKSKRTGPIPPEILKYAAKLAAMHSRAKYSSYVPVWHTSVKYVRKPKGSPPGVVSFERIKTIFVELHQSK